MRAAAGRPPPSAAAPACGGSATAATAADTARAGSHCCRLHAAGTCRNAAIGRLCEKCDGKCPICDSYVRPATLVRVCDECNYGSYEGRCVICGGIGVSDAYYCKECTLQEKDVSRCAMWPRPRACALHAVRACCACVRAARSGARAEPPLRCAHATAAARLACLHACAQRDGCPKIINLGSAKTDLFYERKKYGFRKH